MMQSRSGLSSEPTLSILSADCEMAYETFLRNVREALFYYSTRYARFLEKLLDCNAQYWVCWQDSCITGVLPLMWCEGPFGQAINSLPYFGSNGGVLAINQVAEAALLRKYEDLAGAQTVASATWISNPLRPTEAVPLHNLEDERIGQFTSLDWKADSDEELMRLIDSSARRNIQKAVSLGISVSVQNNYWDFLEFAHRLGMQKIGGRAKSAKFFDLASRYFVPDSDYRIYVASRRGTPIAALLVFYFNQTVEYYMPATLPEEREAQPMAVLLRAAMLDAARSGYTLWNWGGTWLTQLGVLRFKRKWGAQEFRYKYYITLNAKDLLDRSPEELAQHYPGFYMVPYAALAPGKR